MLRHDACNNEKPLVHAIANSIRKVWHRHPLREATLNRVHFTVQEFKKDGSPRAKPTQFWSCEICNQRCKKSKSPNYPQIHVDHIDPVVPIDREITWHEYIQRLFFSGEGNLQAICSPCHKQKTKLENAQRKRKR